MSGYSGGEAPGRMSAAGHTTVVGATEGITPEDEALLCRVMCNCGKIGVWTRGGGRLQRQKCVEERIDAENARSIATTGRKTPYVPEVNYNMTTRPPSPIMSADDPLKPHDDLLGYIFKDWPGKMTGYLQGKQAGIDQIRRPDVVIVHDPTSHPSNQTSEPSSR